MAVFLDFWTILWY